MLRPSAAHTWVVCHGYAAMRAAYPEAPDESDNEVREDGTAAHWLAQQALAGIPVAVDAISPNNRVCNEEMHDGVDLYVSTLRELGFDWHIEERLDLSCIYPGMEGTPDAWCWNPLARKLSVADFKYGFRPVDPFENWQMLCYLEGLLEKLGLHDWEVTVEFVIVQPRSFHRSGPVRVWRFHALATRALANILKFAAGAAMQPNAACTPNPGCGDCPARHACTALQYSALTALERSFDGVPLELDSIALGDELRRLEDAAKRMEARITGLQTQAESLLRSGKNVLGYELAASFARERWTDGSEAKVQALAAILGSNVTKPPKLVTPAQARKVMPPAMVDMYAHKPSTGLRLTRSDPNDARKKFGE